MVTLSSLQPIPNPRPAQLAECISRHTPKRSKRIQKHHNLIVVDHPGATLTPKYKMPQCEPKSESRDGRVKQVSCVGEACTGKLIFDKEWI